MAIDITRVLAGSERIRIEQLLPAIPGWRAVRAYPHADGGWQIDAIPVVCWALTHRTDPHGEIVDHGVEGMIHDEAAVLVPHGDVPEVLTLLSPDEEFSPDDYMDRLPRWPR